MAMPAIANSEAIDRTLDGARVRALLAGLATIVFAISLAVFANRQRRCEPERSDARSGNRSGYLRVAAALGFSRIAL
jgi:hypothetical protein